MAEWAMENCPAQLAFVNKEFTDTEKILKNYDENCNTKRCFVHHSSTEITQGTLGKYWIFEILNHPEWKKFPRLRLCVYVGTKSFMSNFRLILF